MALTAVIGLLLVGCGGSNNDDGGTAASAGQAPSADADFVAKKKQEVERLFKGTYQAPPASPKPVTGKKILIVSCGQSFSTCAEVTGGAERAAKALGWQTQIFDTKGDPTQAAAGIRQGIASKADGVYLYATDCPLVKQALREARRANLAVVAGESVDCDYGAPDQEKLFTGVVTYVEGSYDKFIAAAGEAQADYVIAKSEGKAKVLIITEDDLLGPKLQSDAQIRTFKECAGCTIHVVKHTFGDLGGAIQQKAEQWLVQYPDVDTVIVQFDAVLLAGVYQAVQSSGRKLMLIAGEGGPETMDFVRNGTVAAGIGVPLPSESFAAMDILNRHFHGQEQASSGIGVQIYDKDHNLSPPGQRFVPPIDFEEAYKKVWGVTG